MALIPGLHEIPFSPGIFGNVCARPFLSWWQWRRVVRAMQCITSCGPGMLLLASALPLLPSIAFPNTHIHPCTRRHGHVHCLTLSPAPSHTQTQAHVTNTQSPDTCTDTSKEKKLKELLLGGGQGDKARHVGTGCQFSFLRPVRCFGTDPPFYNLSHPAERWPHPNCWHCWTLAHTPLSHMNVPSALHLLPALVPPPTLSLVNSNSVNMNLCVFQASSSEICFFLEGGSQVYPRYWYPK